LCERMKADVSGTGSGDSARWSSFPISRFVCPVKRLLDFRYVSPVKKNSALFRAGNFCKAKDKESGAGKRSSRYQSHQGDKYATPDSTRGRVDDGPLRADHRRLFMLCWAARASDVLITPLLLNDRGRFARVNGNKHSLKSPTWSCVSITLSAASRRRKAVLLDVRMKS
jgi:hypothetical protein